MNDATRERLNHIKYSMEFSDSPGLKPCGVSFLLAVIEDLAAKLEAANHENTIKHNQICTLKSHLEANAGNYWAWQGDGENYLESLTCPVVIRPEDLREILEKLEAAEKDTARLNWLQANRANLRADRFREILWSVRAQDGHTAYGADIARDAIDAARQAEEGDDA